MIPTMTNPLGISPAYGRRLQYLESTGTQYIDTGVKPDLAGGDSIEMSFFAAAYTGSAPCIFGSRESGVRNAIYLLPNTLVVGDSTDYTAWSFAPNILSGDYVLTANDSAIVIGSNSYTMPRRVTVGLPLFLFALNNYGTGTFGIYNGMKLYDWKYYRNGTLAQHLIPVMDKNGVPCLYDTVTRTFKYNAGTGIFNYA